jgi:YesN/AraC family two-component response regulator
MEQMKQNRNKKLLFVEDDLLILDDLRHLTDWEAAGYQIFTAVNGKQGLQKYEKHRPELVVTDVKMPLMDGLEMMQAIRELNPYVQFMILSSYEDYAYLREALQLGASDYIRKPSITQELLLGKVNELRRRWEENAVIAWAQLKGSFRELWENSVRTPEETVSAIQGMRKLCSCFAREDMLEPFHIYAEKTMGRKFSTDETFFKDLEDGLMPSLYSEAVTKALRYIQASLGAPDLSNAAVAARVGLSERRLGVRFKEETGHTINEYITAARMEWAKALLAAGRMVYETAELVGYRSPQYFSSAFKAYTGLTPNEVRGGGSE